MQPKRDTGRLYVGEGHGVFAPTKSEARAKIKAARGIPRKGRLPIGFSLRRYSN